MEAMAAGYGGSSYLNANPGRRAGARARARLACTANGSKQVRLRVVAREDRNRVIPHFSTGVHPSEPDPLEYLRDFAAAAAAMEQTADLKFWKVSEDPFERRGGKFLIWNRKSYDALVKLVEAGLKKRYKRFIILGTAGAGKSSFSIRWMLKLAAEGSKIVIKQADEFHLLDFSVDKSKPNVSGPHSRLDDPIVQALGNPDAWLIIDGQQETRVNFVCNILQASSTTPASFEEFGKSRLACRLYLPVWSKEEVVSFLIDFEPYRMEYRDMGIDDSASVLNLFAKIGGVPRYFLDSFKAEEGRLRVEAALGAFAVNIEQAMQVLAGGFVPSLSDRVVHIFVRQENYFTPVYGFASPQVKRRIIEQVEIASDVRIRSLLKATVHNPSLATVWGMVQGGKVRIKRVEKGRSEKIFCLVIPPSSKRQLRDMNDLKKMVGPGIYVQPVAQNFPVADGFKGTTIVQVFKRQSGSHGFNGNGLVKIDKLLQLSRYKLWSCVPPELFNKTGFQNYDGLENDDLENTGTQKKLITKRKAGTQKSRMLKAEKLQSDVGRKARDSDAIRSVVSKCVQYVVEIDYDTVRAYGLYDKRAFMESKEYSPYKKAASLKKRTSWCAYCNNLKIRNEEKKGKKSKR